VPVVQMKADLEHGRDPVESDGYGVMSMPALVINGKIKAAGRMPSQRTIKQWLLEARGW
jgi:hypothetical protein